MIHRWHEGAPDASVGLTMSADSKRLSFGSDVVETSSEAKILYPEDGITKGQVIDYYRRIADFALPHARERFLTLQRFPDGIGEDGFFQQARPDYFPKFVPGVRAKRVTGGHIEHISITGPAGLVYLADQNTVTFHAWLSRHDRPNHPDRMVFDLDPSNDDFEIVRQSARWTRELLVEIGCTPFLMTTGSRGMHVIVPLDRSEEFDAVRAVAQNVARVLTARHPESLSVAQRREKREGRLYVDVMRNSFGQTAVMPYSLRARAGAPVATPLHWAELDNGDLHSRRYSIANLFRRFGQIDDPWADLARHASGISGMRTTLEKLLST